MTGVEAEQEFDFDFLFEFKHSDEGGGGGSRRGGRGSSGGAGGGMLRGALPCQPGSGGGRLSRPDRFGGVGGPGEAAVLPGMVGPVPGGACRPRRGGKRRAGRRRPRGVKCCPGAPLSGALAAPGRACLGGTAGGGFSKLGDLFELFKAPRCPLARPPSSPAGSLRPAGLPGAGGGRPHRTALTAPPVQSSRGWKWGSGSCPLPTWAGSKPASAPLLFPP